MTDFNTIELYERGGTIVDTLPEAIEVAEDHLRTSVICEIGIGGEWREKPVRLWFDHKWYAVRELELDSKKPIPCAACGSRPAALVRQYGMYVGLLCADCADALDAWYRRKDAP